MEPQLALLAELLQSDIQRAHALLELADALQEKGGGGAPAGGIEPGQQWLALPGLLGHGGEQPLEGRELGATRLTLSLVVGEFVVEPVQRIEHLAGLVRGKGLGAHAPQVYACDLGTLGLDTDGGSVHAVVEQR
jgi:hypothetical protein